MTQTHTVGKLLERLHGTLQLEQLAGDYGHDREIGNSDISSPGLALAGFVGRFMSERSQVIGETEMTYLASLTDEERRRNLGLFFSFPLPCVFITKGMDPAPPLLDLAVGAGVPVFRTSLKTNEFYRHVKPVLELMFAPSTTLHGSLADVFGVGLLFTGASGIGKSECVLDLVERGHRLVADDVVIVSRRGNDVLIGRGHELQRHFMEIRGVGLIDIPAVFGIRAVRQQKRIEVVVQLKEWSENIAADRTGLDGEVTTILGVELPLITVFLNPGKNITVISEVIAMNHLLRYSGIDPAEAFNQRLLGHMRQAADVRRYLVEDDE
ncbi:MAG: HPr(Ser) kinase/phosphatase [Gemmatimonadaceae bacterium]|nr:HPr(Ser) kinase/phosphatase [Gemmatimonadaceae bacterium]